MRECLADELFAMVGLMKRGAPPYYTVVVLLLFL
jgi:hypothetical protein